MECWLLRPLDEEELAQSAGGSVVSVCIRGIPSARLSCWIGSKTLGRSLRPWPNCMAHMNTCCNVMPEEVRYLCRIEADQSSEQYRSAVVYCMLPIPGCAVYTKITWFSVLIVPDLSWWTSA